MFEISKVCERGKVCNLRNHSQILLLILIEFNQITVNDQGLVGKGCSMFGIGAYDFFQR